MNATMPELARDWASAEGYLLSHSVGLPPSDAAQATAAALFDPWTARDDLVWSHWLDSTEAFRRALGSVINADARNICPQPSVTAALAQILSGLPQRSGRRRLLISAHAFASMGFLFGQAQRRGFELVMLPEDADTLDPAVWAAELDERVHCVLFTHVHSNTGVCHTMTPLCEAARAVGAISVVDVAQSIGIRDVDSRSWGADFIIGSCIKWLCGGSGAAFLWASDARLTDCEPIDVGWFSHADPFEFDIRSFRYAEDALRFWGGTPSVAPAIIATHSVERILKVGLGGILAHNQRLLDRLSDGLAPAALVSPRDPAQRGGSAIVHLGADQDGFIARMRDAGLHFDSRSEGVRLSPHLYNGPDDIDRVLACV